MTAVSRAPRLALAATLLVGWTTAAPAQVGTLGETAEGTPAGTARLGGFIQYGGGRGFDFGGAHALVTGARITYAPTDAWLVAADAGFEFDERVPFVGFSTQYRLPIDLGRADLALRGAYYAVDGQFRDLAAVEALVVGSYRLGLDGRFTPYGAVGIDIPLSRDTDGLSLRETGDDAPVGVVGLMWRSRDRLSLYAEALYVSEPLVGLGARVAF